MALESFEIIEGGSLELSLPTGHQLRADWVAAGVTETETITAAADTATFTPTGTGCFYPRDPRGHGGQLVPLRFPRSHSAGRRRP